MCTMEPPPRSRIGPTTILVSTKAPTRLIRSTSAKSAASTFSSGALSRTAAEFTSTSTPPHCRRGLRHQAGHVRLRAHVARLGAAHAAGGRDRLRHLAERPRPAAEDGHARALAREAERDRPADAGAAARPRSRPYPRARPSAPRSAWYVAHARRIGQGRQRGARAVHQVAPKSISAWL